HKVAVSTTGGPCGNTGYQITCNPADAGCGPDGTYPDPNFDGTAAGQWRDLVVAGKDAPPQFSYDSNDGGNEGFPSPASVLLTDGRLLVIAEDFSTYVFDPAASPPWTSVGMLEPKAIDLDDSARAGRPLPLPGGKALVKVVGGYALFHDDHWSALPADYANAINGHGAPR